MTALERPLQLEGPAQALASHWHPVALRSEVAREPFGTTLLGVPIVLFEDGDGEVNCLRDLCVHRGAKLSLGCVVDGRLRCPFHGWEYDGSGACVRIPQLDADEPIPSKAKAFVHDCVVRYGLVWVRLLPGEDPIPEFPEWDDPRFLTAPCLPFTWAASAERMVENFTDFAHLAFVHPGLLADPDQPAVPHHEVTRDDTSLSYGIELPLVAVGQGGEPTVVAVNIDYVLRAPYSIRTVRRQGGVFTRATFFAVQPLTDTDGRGFMVLAVAKEGEGAAEVREAEARLLAMVELQDVVQRQDQPIVETQRPEHLPFDLSDELHLRFDRVSVQYRHLLRARGLR